MLFVGAYIILGLFIWFGIEIWEGIRKAAGEDRYFDNSDPVKSAPVFSLIWPISLVIWLLIRLFMAIHSLAKRIGKKLHEAMQERELRSVLIGGTSYRQVLRCGSCGVVFVDEEDKNLHVSVQGR